MVAKDKCSFCGTPYNVRSKACDDLTCATQPLGVRNKTIPTFDVERLDKAAAVSLEDFTDQLERETRDAYRTLARGTGQRDVRADRPVFRKSSLEHPRITCRFGGCVWCAR